MKDEKINIKITLISWHLFIVYLIGVIIALANVPIESELLNSIHKIIKLLNYPLYIMSIASVVFSFIEVLKEKTKKNIVCLIYSISLVILEIVIIRIFYTFLSAIN